MANGGWPVPGRSRSISTDSPPVWTSWTANYSLFGFGDGHRVDGHFLLRGTSRGADRIDLSDDIHPRDDLPEQGIAGRQPDPLWSADDEELAAIGVRPGVGHRERSELVAPWLGQLVFETVPGATPAGALRITALQHEAGNDSVEDDVVVIVVAGQEDEVVDR